MCVCVRCSRIERTLCCSAGCMRASNDSRSRLECARANTFAALCARACVRARESGPSLFLEVIRVFPMGGWGTQKASRRYSQRREREREGEVAVTLVRQKGFSVSRAQESRWWWRAAGGFANFSSHTTTRSSSPFLGWVRSGGLFCCCCCCWSDYAARKSFVLFYFCKFRSSPFRFLFSAFSAFALPNAC